MKMHEVVSENSPCAYGAEGWYGVPGSVPQVQVLERRPYRVFIRDLAL